MGKGGSNTTKTEVKLPPELMEAAKANLQIADEAASIGYVPYTEGQTAGFSPQQLAGMQGIDQSAAAFGMPNQLGKSGGAGLSEKQIYERLLGMAAPNRNNMGFGSFSAMPIYNQALQNMAPGQRATIASMTRNPFNADAATNPAMPKQNFIDPSAYARTDNEASRFAKRRAAYARKGITAGGSLAQTEGSKASGGGSGSPAESSHFKLPGYLQQYQSTADRWNADGVSRSEIFRRLQRRYDS